MNLDTTLDSLRIVVAGTFLGVAHSLFCFVFPPSALAAPLIAFMTICDEEIQPKVFGVLYLGAFIATIYLYKASLLH